jgi:hypothetical protein
MFSHRQARLADTHRWPIGAMRTSDLFNCGRELGGLQPLSF